EARVRILEHSRRGVNRHAGRHFTHLVATHPITHHIQAEITVDQKAIFVVLSLSTDVAQTRRDIPHTWLLSPRAVSDTRTLPWLIVTSIQPFEAGNHHERTTAWVVLEARRSSGARLAVR